MEIAECAQLKAEFDGKMATKANTHKLWAKICEIAEKKDMCVRGVNDNA